MNGQGEREALAELAQRVRDQTGITLEESRLPALAAAVSRVEPNAGISEFVARAGSGSQPALIGRLVDEITIQETYFFREMRDLRAIDWRRLHNDALVRGAGQVRVWVAACATGEEAYTIAILAAEAFRPAPPPVSILAADISGRALERGIEGRYRERSIRPLPEELRERYLQADGDTYVVRESLRSLVRFRHHNLARGPFPPTGETAFDLIACRNVLIYFGTDLIPRVIEGMESALLPGGQLVLGSADRLSAGVASPARVVATPEPKPRERKAGPRRPRQWRGPGPAADEQARPAEAEAAEDDELAMRIAGVPDRDGAARKALEALEQNPLDADAFFVRGLAELGGGDARAAVASFRRALYIDPSFGLAAFKLGRAHDALGDTRAAKRAYEQALRTIDPEDRRHGSILDQVDLGDIASACRARLVGLAKGQ